MHFCSCVCVRDFGSYWLVGWFLRPAVGVFWVTYVVAVKTEFIWTGKIIKLAVSKLRREESGSRMVP